MFRKTKQVQVEIKDLEDNLVSKFEKEADVIDKRIGISVTETNNYATQLKVAGDVLEFYTHTNVLEFDRSHPMF